MGKHHFVRIGSVLVLFALAIRCDALLWDFNKKAQENDWKVISGTGEIDKGAYKISHNAEGLVIAGESNWTDYTITCKARLTKAGDTFNNIAICVRASDDGQSEYIFMLEGSRQQAEWWSKIGGKYTEIKAVPMEIDTKDWFQIKIIARGNTFEGYYDGLFVAEIKDKGLRTGKVGARVYGSTAHIDDFDVNGKGIDPSPVEAKDKLTTTWSAIKMVVEH